MDPNLVSYIDALKINVTFLPLPPLYIVTHTKSNYPLSLTMQQLEEFFNDTFLTLPAC